MRAAIAVGMLARSTLTTMVTVAVSADTDLPTAVNRTGSDEITPLSRELGCEPLEERRERSSSPSVPPSAIR
jgi:hypothetical protein